jgi:hypothetical protein
VNKSVPTLLGIAIILLVVIAVFTVFQYKFYSQMANGGVVVGTSAHQMLTGAEPQGEQVSASDVLASRMEKRTPITISPSRKMQEKAGERMAKQRVMRQRQQAGQTAHRAKAGKQAPAPG